MVMKTRILALSLICFAFTAQADDFLLDGMTTTPTGKNDIGQSTVRISGKCGAAMVSIADVVRDDDGSLSTRSGAVLSIEGSKGSISSKQPSPLWLDSGNDIACVNSPKGPRVVLAAWCMATSCDPVNYEIVDPASMKLLTGSDTCDRKCAEKILSTKLPEALQSF